MNPIESTTSAIKKYTQELLNDNARMCAEAGGVVLPLRGHFEPLDASKADKRKNTFFSGMKYPETTATCSSKSRGHYTRAEKDEATGKYKCGVVNASGKNKTDIEKGDMNDVIYDSIRRKFWDNHCTALGGKPASA